MAEVIANFEAIYHHFNRVLAARVQRGRTVQFDHFTIDARPNETLRTQFLQQLEIFALAFLDHRRQQHQPRTFGQRQHLIDHLADGLRVEVDTMIWAARNTSPRVQQPQIIVDFGDGTDRGTRIVRGGFLLDGNRWRQPFDVIHIRLFHQRQKLPGIRGQ